MDYMTTLKNSTIVVMLISLLMFFNNYFKNDEHKNKKVDIIFGKVNDEICELSDISDWGQYIIIDD